MSIRRLATTMLLAVTVMGACGGTSTAEQSMQLVSPAEASDVLTDRAPDVVLLDVRTAQEFNEISVPGAINIDFYATDFSAQIDELAKDVPYVIYCRSGNRSSSAIEIMDDLGFAEVWDVDGGIIAWSEAGLPLTR